MDTDTKPKPFIPIAGQYFPTFIHWVNRASRDLTCHTEYNNTEGGDKKGWRGYHFTTMCFDQKGRRCRIGADFHRARDEGAFPIWWIWPDQIYDMIASVVELQDAAEDLLMHCGISETAPEDKDPIDHGYERAARVAIAKAIEARG